MSDYEQALAVNGHYALAYYGRGTVKQAQKNLGGALADYKQAIRFDPSFAAAIRARDVIVQFLRQTSN
jgi:hypothetical protein